MFKRLASRSSEEISAILMWGVFADGLFLSSNAPRKLVNALDHTLDPGSVTYLPSPDLFG
jgi:hypothetical protein